MLGPEQVAYGILNCAYAVDSLHNPDAAAALASAVNDWLAAEWLAHEPRLRASLVVPSQYPELAAREIERLGGHPGFVQVFLPVRSAAPYGNRCFHPLFAAAARHDLAVGIHFGGAPGNPPTPSGWPSFYIEEYAGMASVFQSQLLSLISEGLFDQFPTLRVALIESGFTWLPSLMWRFDKEWKGLRREVPWVRRLPSDYIREHVRLTLQPFDAPPDPNICCGSSISLARTRCCCSRPTTRTGISTRPRRCCRIAPDRGAGPEDHVRERLVRSIGSSAIGK